jgi:hypothetical protein
VVQGEIPCRFKWFAAGLQSVGLTFFLLLWMVTARTKAVKARETSRGHRAGQKKYPARVAQIGNCYQQSVPKYPPVLLPDRAGAALRRADLFIVLMSCVRGDAICPCRHFRHRTTFNSAPGVVCRRAVLLAMWIYFALEASLRSKL